MYTSVNPVLQYKSGVHQRNRLGNVSRIITGECGGRWWSGGEGRGFKSVLFAPNLPFSSDAASNIETIQSGRKQKTKLAAMEEDYHKDSIIARKQTAKRAAVPQC